MALPKNSIHRFLFRSFSSLFATIATVLLSVYQSTLEFVVEGDDHIRILKAKEKNYIVAVWHTFVDAAAFGFHTHNLLVYSDHPRTKKYINSFTNFSREIGLKTLSSLGYDILDASNGKQSQGIMNFIKRIRSGAPALVAPDGPHGPNYEAKPGVIYMAKKSGSLVLPVGIGCSRRIVGPNWDDFVLPLPFSRVALVIGEPIVPDEDTGVDSLALQAKKMEQSLDELCFRARDLAEK